MSEIDGVMGAASSPALGLSASTKATAEAELWHQVGATGEPAFASGWSSATGVYFILNIYGFVVLHGKMSGSPTAPLIFTLPEGFRPPQRVFFHSSQIRYPTERYGVIEVWTDGQVRYNGATTESSIIPDFGWHTRFMAE